MSTFRFEPKSAEVSIAVVADSEADAWHKLHGVLRELIDMGVYVDVWDIDMVSAY